MEGRRGPRTYMAERPCSGSSPCSAAGENSPARDRVSSGTDSGKHSTHTQVVSCFQQMKDTRLRAAWALTTALERLCYDPKIRVSGTHIILQEVL